jgi:hypothetical protein
MTQPRSSWAIALPCAAAILSCGPSSVGPQDDGGGGGTDGPPGAIDGSTGADAWQAGPDASCGEQTEEIALVNLGDPPDLLIVLDRSGSMMLSPNFPMPGDSKWLIMTNALTEVTASLDSNIRFGLSVFPSDAWCAVDDTPVVGIDLDQGPEIGDWMGLHGPDGNTPAHWALEAALTIYSGLPVNEAGRYVLFATDGVPNCGGEPPTDEVETKVETLAAVTALHNAGIDSFVLGFGAGLTLDATLLNDAAQAGGVPRPGGPPYYYQAEDAAGLEDVLLEIAGGIIVPSCSYQLASPPPDPDAVTVTLNGVPVPRSTGHTNGWDYYPDANTITFFGSYCDDIMSGDVLNVRFVYGCPGPEVD